MTCIATAYGASPLTFLGLAGVGDLFLTVRIRPRYLRESDAESISVQLPD